ncbi:MAG TPA: tetratricopeptide repeat protein [Pyrinomonadaceae bacterium]|nr:tetratricopeptide repeat protein [Pyrinomonadaceae bacterium]
MQITSPKTHTSQPLTNDEALLCCNKALELRDKGDADGALDVMQPLWKGLGQRPATAGLHPTVVPDVLLCVGILTGWIGSRNEIKEADGWAKDLITESITIYESAGDLRKVAEARSALAYCYWRAGALDEARIMFNQALERLTVEGKTRADALLGLAVVEWSASRNTEALRILTANAALFKRITNQTIKGSYHNQLAMVLRKQAAPEIKGVKLKRIIDEYKLADYYFKRARNVLFRAMVQANIANLLRDLTRYREAQEYLDQARRLTGSVRDKVRVAQVDQTRAEVMIEQGRFKEAENVLRLAAVSFEKAGRQCLLVEALETRGRALARLGRTEEAQFSFQRAIEIAQQAGAPNKAGLAVLSMIEELDDLSPETLGVAYKQANEWLAESQSKDVLRRINAAASKVFSKVERELIIEDASADVLLNKPLDFEQEKLKTEKAMIKRALALADGSLTRAAALLNMTYQKLAYIMDTRHKDLLKERTPIRRRAGPGSRK